MSFCDFFFIKKHFLFLKSVVGKGVFDLFLASMFLVGGDDIWGWIMFGGFAFFGVFFVLIGCACIEGYDDADINSKEVADSARNSITKKDLGSGADDETLLSQSM